MEQDDWRTIAFQREFEFFETIGTRHYDEIDKSDIFQLKKKVGFATCGKPSEMPQTSNYNIGYTKEQLVHIKSICDKIVEKSDYDPIRFSCTILVLHHQGVVCETPIFRIVTKTGNIFVDAHARVYQSWELFLQDNKLPDCEFCYPINGEYNRDKECLVGFAFSPASSLMNKATSCLDTAGSVAAVAAAGVIAAGTFVSVAPVALSAAGATAICTGVYNVTRSIGSLYDRRKHEQSVGLKDQESRSAWMAIGSSAVGITQIAALRGAQKLVESGKSVSKLGLLGLHTLTASSLIFSGFGFVENLFICTDKYNKGILTKKDVFDLSCELLFLFNAIASAKATSMLVNNMNVAVIEASSSQKNLTKTQKRNLRRRVAKRRARGLLTNAKEESNRVTGVQISGTLQLLLFEAAKAYSPRLHELLYTLQSVGHDVMCWRNQEISMIRLMNNLTKTLNRFYNNQKDEIKEVLTRVIKFFSAITDDLLKFIYKLFETSSEVIKSIFCTKMMKVEDEIELLINEAEGEVMNLHESLNLVYDSVSSDHVDEESIDDVTLSQETQGLLKGCRDVMDATQWSCSDIEDFEDVFDGVKYVIVSEFKSKMNVYKLSLEAARAAAGDSFNIVVFHEKLGIKGEVSQYFFYDTLKTVIARDTIFKIKSKFKDIKKSKTRTSNSVWEALTDEMFHYYGPHGTGDLSEHELVSVVKNIVSCTSVCGSGIDLSEVEYSIIKEKDIILMSLNDIPNLQIVIYCGITEWNTASGIVVIVK